MDALQSENSPCPKCGATGKVVPKMLLIAEGTPVYGVDIGEGGKWPYQLAVDQCIPEAVREAPLGQFIDGYFCQDCGIGFVPTSLLSRAQ